MKTVEEPQTMFNSQTKIIETQRLTLRPLIQSDVDALFLLYSDPEVRRYFPEGVLTYEQTQEGLEGLLNRRHLHHPGLGMWAIIDRETGAFIGRCGLVLQMIDRREEVEVSYLLATKYWGKGLASEAAQAMVRFGFDQLKLSRLICTIDRDNQASIKVATKIGMSFEKESADHQGPFLMYSMGQPVRAGC